MENAENTQDDGGFDILSITRKNRDDMSPVEMISRELLEHYKAVEKEAHELLLVAVRLAKLLDKSRPQS
jgi:hypothetical protein